jgi:putative endonuclease
MRSTGSHYEQLACAHLERAGLVLIERNFNCRHGELDLVMRDRDVIVFVEVRYRRGAARSGFGDGMDSVGAAKRAKLVRAAGAWLARHPREARLACRFDVVAVDGEDDAASLEWRASAFDAA